MFDPVTVLNIQENRLVFIALCHKMDQKFDLSLRLVRDIHLQGKPFRMRACWPP